jgi:hypothetical protein
MSVLGKTDVRHRNRTSRCRMLHAIFVMQATENRCDDDMRACTVRKLDPEPVPTEKAVLVAAVDVAADDGYASAR